MKKALILFTTAALVTGSAFAGSAVARERSDRAELSANQIADQYSARTARIKADLRLTPEQERNWPGFESAMSDIAKQHADRHIAMRAERKQQKESVDVIEHMRAEAKFLGERSADRKALADAAQPLYASLDEKQKRQFAEELLGRSRRSDVY